MTKIPSMPLAKMVKDNRVLFDHYRAGNLWYKLHCGTDQVFEFPVPIEDIGEATFFAEDRAILFMRYIRKHLATLKEGKLD